MSQKSNVKARYKKGPTQGVVPTPAQGKMTPAKGGMGNKKAKAC